MLVHELPDAWRRAAADPQVGAVVVTGSGDRFFCTGVDLKDPEMSEVLAGNQPALAVKITGRQNDVWKPIITAINGLCVGGGLMFVADSDITIGSTAAAFSNPGVSIGIAAHMGAAVLSRTANFQSILRMTLLGKHGTLDAPAAVRAGLLEEVVEPSDLLDAACRLASHIAANSPAAVTDALRTLWGALELPLSEARTMSEERAGRFRDDPDALEWRLAMKEGREPVWAAYREPTADRPSAG